jgi:enoyl-CoA hydratase/carnithine racemase
MSNRPIRADEIFSLGLAELVVEEGTALAAALERARQLAALPPLALARLRALVDSAPTHGFEDHLDAERDAVASLWLTGDFREGIGAFLERRPPRFTGR